MVVIASQITNLRLFFQPFIQRQVKENIKAPRNMAFVRGLPRGPVNSPHIWPVTRKMFLFDDVIMEWSILSRFAVFAAVPYGEYVILNKIFHLNMFLVFWLIPQHWYDY